MHSIASLSISCTQLFDQVEASLSDHSPQDRSNLRLEDIEDLTGSFKLWAGNLGAFQKPQSLASVEYRLRQSPKVAAEIRQLLRTLSATLEHILAITCGEKQNRLAGSDESNASTTSDDEHYNSASDAPLVSEAEELFELARFTITSLFRFASLIRNSTSRDSFARASYSKYTELDPTFEIQHVREKYPHLTDTNGKWLNTRLGVANSQRRGYLAYVRDHQQKLELLPPEMPFTNDERDTHLTTASTFVDPKTGTAELVVDDRASEASSMMSSLGIRDDSYVHPPSLKFVSKGSVEFECPLCRLIQRNLTEHSWKKHMYEDLRPYICTFEDCDLKLFSDPTSWMEHEAANHRSRWQRPLCKTEEFASLAQAKTHLRSHLPTAADDQIDSLSAAARRLQRGYLTSDCPYCNSWEAKLRGSGTSTCGSGPISVTASQYERHVGSHMRQLALFVIPREYMSLDKNDGANNDTDAGLDAKTKNHEQQSMVSGIDFGSINTDAELQSQTGHIGQQSKLSEQLDNDHPNAPSVVPRAIQRSGLRGELPTASSSPVYIFRIDEIRERVGVTPSYDRHGIWNPSTKRGDNERLADVGTTGMWWYCNGQSVQRPHLPAPPQGSLHFQTFSIFYCDGVGFWVLRGDATNPAMGEAWHRLSFDWDEHDHSAYLSNAGENHTLRVQRTDQKWPQMLLPTTNQVRPVTTHQMYGGLQGDLAVFLALIAFSMDRPNVPSMLPRMFHDGRWAIHQLPHGRLNQRGVIVYVYTVPSSWDPDRSSTAQELESYQDGVHGKYYY